MTSPAMGTITFSDRLCIMEKMPSFHPCGVLPTSFAIVPTFSFTSPNIVDRLPLMAPIKIPFIHSLIASSMLCIGYPRAYPNKPESRGTSTIPIRATPPPAISCFMPWLFAPGLSFPYPSRRLITPQMPSPAPRAITRVCNTSIALLKNSIDTSLSAAFCGCKNFDCCVMGKKIAVVRSTAACAAG